MFSEIEPLARTNIQVNIHPIDSDTFGIQITGLTPENEVQGMDAAVELPKGMSIADVTLNADLKENGWLLVKNMDKEPVLITSVGTEKLANDTDVITVDIKGTSSEAMKVYVSVLEHEKSYGDVYPFSFSNQNAQ